MSFQDDIAAIAAEHGPDVAIEWALAYCCRTVLTGTSHYQEQP
ncbi:hypothetical protein [Mycobacterium malmoense]|nr:hypothetical protein [Mycobacterium malmoense]